MELGDLTDGQFLENVKLYSLKPLLIVHVQCVKKKYIQEIAQLDLINY